MVLPTSGLPISFSEMRSEFGPTQVDNSLSIGSYRISDNIGTLTNLPLDTGVPQSGIIKSSDLQAKRLNVVIDLFSGPPTVREDSRSIYDNARATSTQQIIPVGRFKSSAQVPASGSGSRIIANVNKAIGSQNSNRNNVALKTGQWGTNALFEIVIGTSGALYGAGGDGGNGAGYGFPQYFPGNAESGTFQNISSGASGGQGTSALGIQYPTTLINQGTIRAGRGGGGGGGSGYGRDYHDIQDCTNERPSPIIGGGGGAGGSGYPAGSGGLGSTYLSRLGNKQGGPTSYAGNGTSASITTDGQGGGSGSAVPQDFNACATKIAVSGSGGGAELPGGIGDFSLTGPGPGGERGYGIIIDSTGSILFRTGNDPDGLIVNSTVL